MYPDNQSITNLWRYGMVLELIKKTIVDRTVDYIVKKECFDPFKVSTRKHAYQSILQ